MIPFNCKAVSSVLNKQFNTFDELLAALSDYAKEIGLSDVPDGYNAIISISDNNLRNRIITDIDNSPMDKALKLQLEIAFLGEWEMYSACAMVCEEAIKEGLSNPNMYFILAMLYQTSNQVLESLETLEAGLKAYPDDETLLYSKGDLLTNFGNIKEALPIWEKLITIDPQNGEFYGRKGRALLIDQKYKEAIAPLQRAIELNNDPVARLNLLYAYLFSGDKMKAAEQGRTLLMYTSNALREYGCVPEMYHAIGFAAIGDRENALETVKYALDNNGNPDLMIQAEVDIILGDSTSALKKIDEYTRTPGNMGVQHLFYSPFIYPLHSMPGYKEIAERIGLDVVKEPSGLWRPTLKFSQHADMGGSSRNELDRILSKGVGLSDSDLEKINNMCPINMGNMGQLISIDANKRNKVITWKFRITPELMNFDLYKNPKLKQGIEDSEALSMLLYEPEAYKRGWTKKMIFSYPDNSQTLTFEITPDRMRELSKQKVNQKLLDLTFLKYYADMMDVHYREKSIGGADLSENYLTILEEVDNNEGTISQMKLSNDLYRNQLESLIMDPSMRNYMEAMIREGITFKWIYKDNVTEEEFVFEFSPSDIKNLLNR